MVIQGLTTNMVVEALCATRVIFMRGNVVTTQCCSEGRIGLPKSLTVLRHSGLDHVFHVLPPFAANLIAVINRFASAI